MANTAILPTSGQPQTLLGAVAATGISTIYLDVWNTRGGWPLHYTWTTLTTGSPASVTVNIEGSIDGTNFYQLDQSVNTSGELRSIANKPVRWIRANLATLTGGTAPTVTVQIMVVAP